MDKSWMDGPRHEDEYLQGLVRFLGYAFSKASVENKILCPCKKCVNSYWREESEVRVHLICNGFVEGYKFWMFHGECGSSSANPLDCDKVDGRDEGDDISDLLRDLAGGLDHAGDFEDDCGSDQDDAFLESLHKLEADSRQELYPGCKNFSKLRFVVRLLHTKLKGGWSDKSFNMLLDLLKEAYPDSAIPRNYNEAKKLVKSLGFGYVNIHACENDCILFWKDNADANSCPKCHASRWKSERMGADGKRVHKAPKKVLRYFPIQRRLQILFLCSRIASLARWHAEERTQDGLLRHPADSLLWKDFDEKNPDFAKDSRNIRLAIATDGFNPFRSMNLSYSIWPVILIPYNFPPWMVMKQQNFVLSLLIPGPNAPTSDIDVYFEPLVDDMLEMFLHGVRTYDASTGEFFQLRAAIICTISDFPGLGCVTACVTSGAGACPECHSHTCSLRLKNGSKTCYMGHRRFLHENHHLRYDTRTFGSIECGTAPVPLSGRQILELTENIQPDFGKDPKTNKPRTKKRKKGDPLIIWKRKSIWFKLPYWKDLLLHHNFDIMHIEKNVCDNIVNTLLAVEGKTKDNFNSRYDLEALNIREDLQPIDIGEDEVYFPPAPYAMKLEQQRTFCKVFKSAKFPSGYASDLRRNVHVKERKITGLKSHDNHILLQDLLPLAVRRTLPARVSAVLIPVSNFFKQMYSPVIRISDMQRLGAEIAETLSLLEAIFLPSFFDIMVHLMVHLPAQAMIAGPVHFRSMWSIERFIGKLKGHVHTRSHVEGSISEGHLFDESLTFCSLYLGETWFNRGARNNGGLDMDGDTTPFFRYNIGRGLAGKSIVILDDKTWLQSHRYVLFNYDNIEPYLNKHNEYLLSTGLRSRRDIDRAHYMTFHEWFKSHVSEMGDEAPQEIKILSKGASMGAFKYSSYTINGINFHTQSYDEGRPVQSSGVALVAQTASFEKGNGDNISIKNKTYYGIIQEIIELNYQHEGKVVLFKCDWVDNRVQDKWVKTDGFGITTVNFKHLFNTGKKLTDEPFILASQATQVYYVEDPIDVEWSAVVLPSLNGINENEGNIEPDHVTTVTLLDPHTSIPVSVADGCIGSARADVDGLVVKASDIEKRRKKGKRKRKG